MKIFPDIITTNYIFSQIFGIITIIIVCIGYFLKKEKLLLTQILGNITNIVSYIFLGANVAWLGATICVIRCIIFYLYERRNLKVPNNIFCLIILCMVACTFFTWNSFYDLFILTTFILYTVAFFIKKEIIVKIVIAVAIFTSLVYSITIFNFMGLIRCGIELLIDLIAIFRVLLYRRKKQRE